MNFSGGNFLSGIPEVVKNLLIINILMLLATFAASSANYDLAELLGLHHWSSELFKPHQIVTYIFMHGGITHLFFNMFALYMFGQVLEQVWGAKKFLIYYMVTGIGAGIIQLIVTELKLISVESYLTPEAIEYAITNGISLLNGAQGPSEYVTDPNFVEALYLINTGTVGASGAVFGILLAFGMLFPNTRLMLLIPPIPLKAKYFVIIYGALELYLGLSNNPADNVAHFAHLGGMLFGFVLIKYWKTNPTKF